MDAFSTAVAAVQAARLLFELVDDIRAAPDEIKSIAADAHAFYESTALLGSILDRYNTQPTPRGERLNFQVVANALQNARHILEQLRLKISRLLRQVLDGTRPRMIFVGVTWSLRAKREIRNLQSKLEITKSTLNHALTLESFSLSANRFFPNEANATD